ncbi:MAG: bifunctional diguanylate cyclase/phosphodiesterase, partial [Methylococcaceae bacterium]
HYETLFGYALGSLPATYLSLELGVHPDDQPQFRQALQHLTSAGSAPYMEMEHRAIRADGGVFWVKTCGKVVEFDKFSGLPSRVVGTRLDISFRKAAEKQLKLFELVFESLSDCVMLLDADERIISVNPAIERIYGYTPQEVIGQTPHLFNSGRHDKDFFAVLRATVKETGHWQGQIWNRKKNGEIYPEWLNVSLFPAENESSVYYVCVYSDLSSQANLRQHLHYLAYYDPLTELPNRVLHRDRLLDTLSTARREKGEVGIMFIDLDRFKTINDTLGHHVGDELLKVVAQRVKGCLRESDTVARLGGDEFSIVLYPVDGVNSLLIVADKIIDAINPPIHLGENTMQVGASIGISVYPQDGEDVDVLLRNADAAMYKAKEEGRNQHQLFSQVLFDEAFERYTLESEIVTALQDSQFRIYFQPLVRLDSGAWVGAEALVRWQHPVRGLIAPASFIKLAENAGLITKIDAWVLEQTCRQVAAWDAAGMHLPRIAVNIAGKDIEHSDLPTWVSACLQRTGLEPRRLELEVSEDFFMKNEDKAIASLESLRRMGVSVSIDDFGTGYSSLSQIKRLPVGRLKIDQSFIKDISHDPDDENITRTIIALGKYLGLEITAEGIESQAQRHFLLDNGCQEGQGYLFGHPMSADEFKVIWQDAADQHAG